MCLNGAVCVSENKVATALPALRLAWRAVLPDPVTQLPIHRETLARMGVCASPLRHHVAPVTITGPVNDYRRNRTTRT